MKDAVKYTQYNFIFNDGDQTNAKHNTQVQQFKITRPDDIKYIKMYYKRGQEPKWLHGFEFLDKSNEVIFKTGWNCFGQSSQFDVVEDELADDERVIGVRCNRRPDADIACFIDF